MKKILAIFITLALIFSTTPMIAIASELDGENQVTTEETINEVAQPQIPIITYTMTEDDANQLIDDYNSQVDQYNDYVTEENARRREEHQQAIQEVDEHNTQEQQKVEENAQQLQKQEKLEQKIVADSQPKTESYTTTSENLPTSWTDTTENPKTISVVKSADSDETYKVANLHIYVDEEAGDTYTGTQVNDENFFISLATQNHLILGEWETVLVGKNDTVTVVSQASLFPHSGAVFLRRLEGYTNGYWMPTQELVSTAKYVADVWDTNGPATEFSYENGTTDRQSIKNVLNVFVYNFLRYGAEPTKVEQYTPDYWEYPSSEVVYLDYLSKLERIIRPATAETPQEEKVIPVVEEPISTETAPIEAPIENVIPTTNEAPITTATDAAPTTVTTTPVINAASPVTNINVTTATNEETTVPIEEVAIEDNDNPLAGPQTVKSKWALVNLILMIVTMLFAIKVPKKEEEEGKEIKKHSNIITIGLAIFSALFFIFTENVRLPMVFTDEYTIWMALITVGGLVSLILTRDKTVEEEEKKEG